MTTIPSPDNGITVISIREGKKVSEFFPFDPEKGAFVFDSRNSFAPDCEDVIEVQVYGQVIKQRVINYFTVNNQYTIPIPNYSVGNPLKTIHWFDSTAKSIVSALDFEGTGSA